MFSTGERGALDQGRERIVMQSPAVKRTAFKMMGLWLVLILVMGALPATVEAAAKTYLVKATKAAVRKSPSTSGKLLGTVKKGTKVSVYQVKGKWAQVKVSGKKGYMATNTLTSSSPAPTETTTTSSSYVTLKSGQSGAAVTKLQQRLLEKGYLASAQVTGKYNTATVKAVRTFQLQHSLTVNGTADSNTQAKLFASSAKAKVAVANTDWYSSSIDSSFSKRATAVILDVRTGTRLNIRRVGGSNHADVEPSTASDTTKLKKLYGGKWSWNSRPIILITGGRYIAAAINGMPHGAQISKTNNFNGQFCLHLLNSKTHGSDCKNAAHQANIKVAYNYFN